MENPLSIALLIRLRFIDVMLDHYGTLNRGLIMDHFGLSQPQASMDISNYIKIAPANLKYDTSAKTYRRSPEFKRYFP